MSTTGIKWPQGLTTTGLLVSLLRATQLSTVSISCFGACYLIWMRNHHFCAVSRYRYQCTGNQLENYQVPLGEVMFVVSCVLVALELLYSTGLAILMLARNKRHDSFTQLCSAWTSVVVFTLGLGAFASISVVRRTWPLCYSEGVTYFNPMLPPETNMCIVTQSAVTTGLIAWIATILLGIIAVFELKKDRQSYGAIRLPFDNPAGRHEDIPVHRRDQGDGPVDAVAIEDLGGI
ncbi:hypothetical protein B0T24DRAFT_640126 [Lasiosphaeria ovina]|uniref:Uncharacterized protein n=1 Tax=Lasiosphaeria ovina TaxID=92902 RepID=A0AAE0JTX7_9PEZI|nr:hypothetical protein B0T24DRAFT_640126 [Lasiosphaeria ovina]